jgi:tripartite-type tricarboxylate transporter receptor subunit TctC
MKTATFGRRELLLGSMASLVSWQARADTFPSRPIQLIVPYSPAGVVDLVMRTVSAGLGSELGGSVIVENKPGANGIVGTEYVAKATPDGYTLIAITASTFAIGPQLYDQLPYDPLKDFAPVAQLSAAPTILVVPNSLPVNSVADLVKLAKEKPGQLNYGSYGIGSAAHLAAELFQIAAGIKLFHIPYKGSGPVLIDLMSGSAKLSLFFDSIPASMPHVKSGDLKALAVTGKARVPELPDVPTLAETYPGFEMTVWEGVGAPAGTPKDTVDRLYTALTKVMADKNVQDTLSKLGADPMCTTPQDFSQEIEQQNAKWKQVLNQIGLQHQHW